MGSKSIGNGSIVSNHNIPLPQSIGHPLALNDIYKMQSLSNYFMFTGNSSPCEKSTPRKPTPICRNLLPFLSPRCHRHLTRSHLRYKTFTQNTLSISFKRFYFFIISHLRTDVATIAGMQNSLAQRTHKSVRRVTLPFSCGQQHRVPCRGVTFGAEYLLLVTIAFAPSELGWMCRKHLHSSGHLNISILIGRRSNGTGSGLRVQSAGGIFCVGLLHTSPRCGLTKCLNAQKKPFETTLVFAVRRSVWCVCFFFHSNE